MSKLLSYIAVPVISCLLITSAFGGGSVRQSRTKNTNANGNTNVNRNVNVNQNVNVNRNVNVNQNVNVNRNVNVNSGRYYGTTRVAVGEEGAAVAGPRGVAVAGEEGAAAVTRHGVAVATEEGVAAVGRYGGVYHGEYYEDYEGWKVAAGVGVGIAIGTKLSKPPAASTTIVVTGTSYYYHDYVFYMQVYNEGQVVYQAVPAPAGAVIVTLPPSCVAKIVGGVTYQYCGSTYYQRLSNGYKVVVF